MGLPRGAAGAGKRCGDLSLVGANDNSLQPHLSPGLAPFIAHTTHPLTEDKSDNARVLVKRQQQTLILRPRSPMT